MTGRTSTLARAAARGPGRAPRRRLRAAMGLGLGLLGTGLLAAGGVGAQEDPNPLLTFTFGSTLTVDDNKALDPVSAGSTSSLDNRLGLRFVTETATSTLSFDASGVLRLAKRPGRSRETDFDGETLKLSYARAGANSRLAFSADYNRTDVDFFDPFSLIDLPETPVDESDLTDGAEGTRTSRGAALSLAVGTEGPFGLTFDASRRDRSFEGTTDPDFFDTRRTSLSLGAILRPSDRTSFSFTLSQSDYSAEDLEQTDRTTRRATLGLQHALTPATTLSFSLGRTWIEVDETVLGLRGTTREQGLNGSLGVTHDLPNGSIGLRLTHDVSVNGDRSTVLFSRDLELPRGSLKVSFGPTFQSGGDSGLVGSLDYSHLLPRGTIKATVDRRVGSNDEDETVDSTRLRLGWTHELSALAGLDMSLDYLDVESDAPGDDRTRTRLRVAYTLALAQDWQLAGGYTHTRSKRELTGTGRSDAVFLSLERAFSFAP